MKENSAANRLAADALEAAKAMVSFDDLLRSQGSSTPTSLAGALRTMREASNGFSCPETMKAILVALDGMDAAAAGAAVARAAGGAASCAASASVDGGQGHG